MQQVLQTYRRSKTAVASKNSSASAMPGFVLNLSEIKSSTLRNFHFIYIYSFSTTFLFLLRRRSNQQETWRSAVTSPPSHVAKAFKVSKQRRPRKLHLSRKRRDLRLRLRLKHKSRDTPWYRYKSRDLCLLVKAWANLNDITIILWVGSKPVSEFQCSWFAPWPDIFLNDPEERSWWEFRWASYNYTKNHLGDVHTQDSNKGEC